MSEAAEIRAWGREQGLDVPVRGPLPATLLEAWEARDDDEDDETPVVVAAPFISAPPADSSIPSVSPASPGEAPPRKPERPPQGKRKPLFHRKPRTGTKPRRVSIENVVASAWGLGAMALAQTPRALPMARVLDMQAPVAGIVVEDIAKGTLVDRILQPLARGGEKAEKAVGLLGPPLIVGLMTARPELYPVLRGPLKLSMMTWMEISGPAMEKAQKRAEAWSEKFGQVDLDAMIDGLFADVPAPAGAVWSEAVSPQEEENIRKARGEP
jgi:hypothetical protein